MKKKGIIFIVLLISVILLSSSLWSEEPYPRPIPLGISGGNILDSPNPYYYDYSSFCCGGTLGALVQDIGGVQYILSNNHILARTNLARIGEDIIQPGLPDQTLACYKNPADAVADLSRFVPISFISGTTNKVDAAIAQVREGQVDPTGFIVNIGPVSASTAVAVPKMLVKKNGRTTDLTKGVINSVNTTIRITYYKTCGQGSQIATFINQILIGPAGFSAGGDAGSLIVEDTISNPRAVGLLFAGNTFITVANPIGAVLSALGVTMVGDGENTVYSLSSFNNVIKVKQRHEKSLLKQEGVIGIGVGFDEITKGRKVIKVFVKDWGKMKRLIPETLDGFPVEVIETEEIIAF